MQRYRYRTLRVRAWDKWYTDKSRKRGGDKPDRILMVTDSGEAERIDFADQKGDDYGAFRERAWANFMSYLNELGDSGWQVVTFRCTSYDYSVPVGDVLLMRTG